MGIMDNQNMEKRRIIYVDAYFNRETNKSKISLYDPEEAQKNILTLQGPTSTSKAEQCAILYGCLYLKKIGLDDRRAYILNDNQAAVKNTKILELCKKLNVGVSWIPREINTIADDGIRLDDNVDVSEANILLMFYKLIIDDETQQKVNGTKLNKKHADINSDISVLREAIKSSQKEDNSPVVIGQIGKYLKTHYPNFKYSSLKKEFLKYPDDFIVLDNNFVKEKK